jgi:hypothetical protein
VNQRPFQRLTRGGDRQHIPAVKWDEA